MTKHPEAASAAPVPVGEGSHPRLFKVIGDLPLTWKHDTSDARLLMPGEVIDFDHLTEDEIALLIGLGHIEPSDATEPGVPEDVTAGRIHNPP